MALPNEKKADPTGSKVASVSATPTITAGLYTIHDALGGKLTFTNVCSDQAARGIIVGATIIDKAKQLAPIDIIVFNADFTATADADTFDPSDADLVASAKHCISVLAANYSSFSDNAMAEVECLKPFQLADGTSTLYAQMVVRGAPTYASTSDLTLILHILKD